MSGRHAGSAEEIAAAEVAAAEVAAAEVAAAEVAAAEVAAAEEIATAESTPVVVTTGSATPTEIAAITAVIGGLLAEEGEARREEEPQGTTAWQRSQRSLRGTLEPGPGRWLG